MGTLDVSVVVGTFGTSEWLRLARDRAVPSARALGVPVFHVHDFTLHQARNAALACVETEWVCHLDADDELEAGYFEAMAEGTAELRAPSVRYVAERHAFKPRVPRVAGHVHDCQPQCLLEGNYLVVGTLARAELLRSVGGWRDWPVYEDYDLWLRCWKLGASVETIPAAVYRAYVRDDSRNRGPAREVKHATHQAIARANGATVPE